MRIEIDILVNTNRIILLLSILVLVTVGCNLPAKSLPTPTEIGTTIPEPSKLSVQSKNVFGITIFTLDDAGGLSKIAQSGTAWTRSDFIWSAIEPTPGARFWNGEFEQGLIRAASAGVQPIMIIGDTPGWALKEGYQCGAVAENQFPTLAEFAYDLVKRYSVPPYNIRYWELWNEPDAAGVLGCWGDPSDTQYYGGYYYGQMLQALYPKIKEADPNAQVLVGGLLLDCDPGNPPEGRTCVESMFLNGILESGAGPYFDGVSFHAYDYYTGVDTYSNMNWNSSSSTSGPVLIAKARYLNKVLSNYGYGEKYLVNTETAVFYGPNVSDPPCDPNAPPDVEVTKVYYLIQSYAVSLAEGLKANIWYAALGGRCAALLNADLSPKPSYYAFQFAQQKLGEAQFIKQIIDNEGVKGYEYDIPGRKLWVMWATDGQVYLITLPVLPLELNKVGEDGHPVQLSNELSLTIERSPLFIEFEK